MGDWQFLKAADGTIVPVADYKTKEIPKAVFLMLPAMGVKAGFYKRLGAGLSENTIATVLLEQRGHGESPYRPWDGSEFGYRDFLDVDIPIALDWIKSEYPDTPIFIGGHSLGGHLGAITAADRPADIAGIINIGCVFPYRGHYSLAGWLMISWICFLVPILSKFMRYFPGGKVGFGGDEYWQLMYDWRDWGTRDTYDFGTTTGVEAKMATYTGPVLSVAIDKDTFASPAGLEKLRGTLSGAQLTRKCLTEEEQGQYLGHFNWARRPDGVVKTMTEWIKECLT